MIKIVTAFVFAAAIGGILIACRAPAASGNMRFSQCPAFTASSWVNPYPPNDTGNKYQISMNAKPFSCAQTQVWVKKFVAMYISAPPLRTAVLKGGPTGYKCTASPDNKHHAYQGGCIKISKAAFSQTFNWGPAH